MWKKVTQTFSAEDINENWNALFSMADLVAEIGTQLSKNLNYNYPEKLETDIRKFLNLISANTANKLT